ncbi:MAG TPA: hypothetical protein VLJ58_16600, partial [Ramlibacter sp.]|nr:hypothetical protein [Ramlibacter sp.]
MNKFFRNLISRGGAATALVLAALLGGQAAHAAGTAAGTSITNKASLTYTVGGVGQTSIGSSPTGSTGTGTVTVFLVDNKIDLAVAAVGSAALYAVPGQTNATVSFTVTNLGNNTQDYQLTPSSASLTGSLFGGTDNFDPTTCTVLTVNGASATYVNDLAPDAVATVVVQCAIPITQVNGDYGLVALTAMAYADTANGTFTTPLTEAANTMAGVENVFADAAGSESTDIARDAEHSARHAYQVRSSTLTVMKTVTTVCDPYNANVSPKNIPGAFVQYSISIANSGSASAVLTTISDALVSSVTIDADFIQSSATPANCAVVGSGGAATSANGSGFRATVTTNGTFTGT